MAKDFKPGDKVTVCATPPLLWEVPGRQHMQEDGISMKIWREYFHRTGEVVFHVRPEGVRVRFPDGDWYNFEPRELRKVD